MSIPIQEVSNSEKSKADQGYSFHAQRTKESKDKLVPEFKGYKRLVYQASEGDKKQAHFPKKRGKKSQKRVTLEERLSTPYSFRKDQAFEIYRIAVGCYGMRLPLSKRPHEQAECGKPNFCLYHQVSGHAIADCWVFKDWVEERLQSGEMVLPARLLQKPAPHKSASKPDNRGSTPLNEGTSKKLKWGSKSNSQRAPGGSSQESCDMIRNRPCEEKSSASPDMTGVCRRCEKPYRLCHGKERRKPANRIDLRYTQKVCKDCNKALLAILDKGSPKTKLQIHSPEATSKSKGKKPVDDCPDEISQEDDPNFCIYHRFAGHRTEDCHTYKKCVRVALKAEEVISPAPKEGDSQPSRGRREPHSNKSTSHKPREVIPDATLLVQMERNKEGVAEIESDNEDLYLAGSSIQAKKLPAPEAKWYSFRQDKVLKIFCKLISKGFLVPEVIGIGSINEDETPEFCIYHRKLGHRIEGCEEFKDWVEAKCATSQCDSSRIRHRTNQVTR